MEVHSISEALDVTIHLLQSIKVPKELTAVTFTQEIGGPILTAVGNLCKVREAVAQAEQEAQTNGDVQDDYTEPAD